MSDGTDLHKFLYSLDAKLDKLDGRIENLEEKFQFKLENMDERLLGSCIDRDEVADLSRRVPVLEVRLAAAEVKLTALELQLSTHKEETIKKKAGIIDGIIKAFSSSVYIILGGGVATIVFWLVAQYLTGHTFGGK